jgi:hypothetical protein
MASKSIPALLKAVEGYSGEHGSSKEHKPIAEQLKAAVAQIHADQGEEARESPGKTAANQAARDTMASEASHGAGDGQKRSNKPGEANAPDPLVDIAGPDGRNDHLTGVAAVNSAGTRRSNLPSSGLPPGPAEIRRIAAQREMARPDSRMKPDGKPGEDNKKTNPPGEGYPAAGRIGDVKTAPIRPGSHAEADRAGSESDKQPEDAPPRVSQQPDQFVGAGNAFQKARKQATAKLVASR